MVCHKSNFEQEIHIRILGRMSWHVRLQSCRRYELYSYYHAKIQLIFKPWLYHIQLLFKIGFEINRIETCLCTGAWLAWSNWSEWSNCQGGRCRIPNVLPDIFGRQKQTRTRRKFSRNLEISGSNTKGVKDAPVTQKSMKITKMENIEYQMNTKLCHFPKCKGTEIIWCFYIKMLRY